MSGRHIELSPFTHKSIYLLSWLFICQIEYHLNFYVNSPCNAWLKVSKGEISLLYLEKK